MDGATLQDGKVVAVTWGGFTRSLHEASIPTNTPTGEPS